MALAEYAKQNPTHRGSPCWVCSLPEVAEINACKLEQTATTTQMIAWLTQEKGYAPEDARVARFNHHFQAGHHRREA